MPAALDSLSSIAASASGLDDTAPSMDEVPVRPTPPSLTGAAEPTATGVAGIQASWWEWLTHKADGIEEWVDQFVHKHTPGNDGTDRDDEARRV
jgi:hypothetical protein